jgi:hypothetical protein
VTAVRAEVQITTYRPIRTQARVLASASGQSEAAILTLEQEGGTICLSGEPSAIRQVLAAALETLDEALRRREVQVEQAAAL